MGHALHKNNRQRSIFTEMFQNNIVVSMADRG